ncbi:hypothetical protein SDC9_202314 [bioreactor metagenome]|uniref:Uncharacterized protein n=1 Tax=bioreactor metagenome TaxID=1076179 RepID=A0A645IUW7_9ZZZZ
MRGLSAELDRTQRVFHRLGEECAARHVAENFLRLRPLHGKQGDRFGFVGDLRVERFDLARQVRPVLFRVRRVDHEDIRVLNKAVKIRVVNRAAVFIRNDRVLRLIDLQRGDVAR